MAITAETLQAILIVCSAILTVCAVIVVVLFALLRADIVPERVNEFGTLAVGI
jgi:hypothetical protein